MKTPEDLMDEFWSNKPITQRRYSSVLIKELCKSYAKQWVEHTSEALNITPRWDACVEQIKQDIDAQ